MRDAAGQVRDHADLPFELAHLVDPGVQALHLGLEASDGVGMPLGLDAKGRHVDRSHPQPYPIGADRREQRDEADGRDDRLRDARAAELHAAHRRAFVSDEDQREVVRVLVHQAPFGNWTCSRSFPIWISSPDSSRDFSLFEPFTKVPFVEPRSFT